MNPRISNWRGLRIWIVGGSTGIGAAMIKPLIDRGSQLAVSARRETVLQQAFEKATGLSPEQARDNGHYLLPANVTDINELRAAYDMLIAQWGSIDVVLWVAGTYQAMQAHDFDLGKANSIVATNLGGVLNGLSLLLPMYVRHGRGHLAIVASVAGYSGLPKALVYGPTKAALINLCESLYLDLRPRGVGVTLVNPGFVDTPLTATNDFYMPAMISADEAARRIISGLELGLFEIHFPHRFSRMLKFLRILPYWLYMRIVARATGGKPEPAAQREPS